MRFFLSIVSILLMIQPTTCHGQYFDTLLSSLHSRYVFHTGILLEDGNIMVAGIKDSSYYYFPVVWKISRKAEIIQTYSLPHKDWKVTIIKQSRDGGYILAGYLTGDDWDALIAKYDKSFHEEWSVKFRNGYNLNVPREIIILPDSSFLVNCLTMARGYTDINSYYLTKINSQGKILWNKLLPRATTEYSGWMSFDHDSLSILSFVTYKQSNNKLSAVLNRLDFDGNNEIVAVYEDNAGLRGGAVYPLPDNKYLLAGSDHSQIYQYHDELKLMIVNEKGQVEKVKSYKPFGFPVFPAGIIAVSHEEFIIYGNSPVSPTIWISPFFMIRIDKNLNLKWAYSYGPELFHPATVLKTESEDFFVIGNNYYYPYFGYVSGSGTGYLFETLKNQTPSWEKIQVNNQGNIEIYLKDKLPIKNLTHQLFKLYENGIYSLIYSSRDSIIIDTTAYASQVQSFYRIKYSFKEIESSESNEFSNIHLSVQQDVDSAQWCFKWNKSTSGFKTYRIYYLREGDQPDKLHRYLKFPDFHNNDTAYFYRYPHTGISYYQIEEVWKINSIEITKALSNIVRMDNFYAIEYPSSSHIKIYPNPTSEMLIISGTLHKTVQLITGDGQLLEEIPCHNNTCKIMMSTFSPGMYYIRVGTGISSSTFKVIKIR